MTVCLDAGGQRTTEMRVSCAQILACAMLTYFVNGVAWKGMSLSTLFRGNEDLETPRGRSVAFTSHIGPSY